MGRNALFFFALLSGACATACLADGIDGGQANDGDNGNLGKEIRNPDGDFVILSPQEAQKVSERSGTIGLRLERKGTQAVVAGVADGGPAEKGGLEAGDVIISVDGRRTRGMSLKDLAESVRGKPGTLVVLRVRKKSGKTLKVPLIRSSAALRGFVPKSPGVEIEQVPLESLGVSECPRTRGDCHLIDKIDGACTYSCPSK